MRRRAAAPARKRALGRQRRTRSRASRRVLFPLPFLYLLASDGSDAIRLEEDDVQDEEDGDDDDGPEDRFLPERFGAVVGDGRGAVYETCEFCFWLGCGHVTDYYSYDYADNPAPERAVKGLGHGARVGRDRDTGESSWAAEGGVNEHADGAGRSYEQAPEAACVGGALPQHAEDDGAEEGRNEEAEERLDVVHDGGCVGDQVGGADGDDHADNGGPAAHGDVVLVGGALVHEGAVDVVGPDGGEGADVAGHAGHEACDERCDAESEQAGAAVADEHEREDFVVAVGRGCVDGVFADQVVERNAVVGKAEADEAGKDDDERDGHLEGGADHGGHLGRA